MGHLIDKVLNEAKRSLKRSKKLTLIALSYQGSAIWYLIRK